MLCQSANSLAERELVFFHFAEDLVDLFLFHQNDFPGSDVVDRSRYFDLSGPDRASRLCRGGGLLVSNIVF